MIPCTQGAARKAMLRVERTHGTQAAIAAEEVAKLLLGGAAAGEDKQKA